MSHRRMTTADAAWLRMDRPDNLMVVTCVFWFDAPLDWDRVTAAFAERLVPAFPAFASRAVEPPVTLGLVMPRWEDVDGFSVADHLHRTRLPAPGGDAELHRCVSDQAAVPLDRRRPLWEAHLVDGYRDGCAILLRTHHALADGSALVQALLTLVDAAQEGPHPGQLPHRDRTVEASLRARAGRLADTALDGWRTALQHPGRALDGVRSLPATNAALTRLGFAASDPDSVLRAPLSGRKSLTWTQPRPLAGLKQAGRAAGATVNDLAVTAIAGALRTHLQERGQDASRLTAVVPVNLRPADAPFDAERGNEFGLAFVRLPVGEPDRRARLAAVQADMARVKGSSEAVVVQSAISAMGQAPTAVEKAWLELFSGRASAVITNVAGPREPVLLAGVPMAGFTAWVPATGPIGLGFSVCSSAGSVVLGLAVDEAVVPDSGRLLAALDLELDLVLSAAAGPAPATT